MRDLTIKDVRVCAYTIPTDRPEADGTLAWTRTTIVIAWVEAGGQTGMGYSYAGRGAGLVITDHLRAALKDADPLDIPACWHSMRRIVRNLGESGETSAAIAAVDTALWDLKGKLLSLPLVDLMGSNVRSMPVYGSGGFTTYDRRTLETQIAGWREQGIGMVKIKVGSRPEDDADRVAEARAALGEEGKLFVDANGAYGIKQALHFAEIFRQYGVVWFEEPVSSDNLAGLRHISLQGPPGMDITAGEYGYDLYYVERMLAAHAVDVLQIDATRCLGYSGFIHAASLALARNTPVSAHCAPALHLPVCCHSAGVIHIEYFYDHVRIEGLLFDGVPKVKGGRLCPDRDRPGTGLIFKKQDAERFRA